MRHRAEGIVFVCMCNGGCRVRRCHHRGNTSPTVIYCTLNILIYKNETKGRRRRPSGSVRTERLICRNSACRRKIVVLVLHTITLVNNDYRRKRSVVGIIFYRKTPALYHNNIVYIIILWYTYLIILLYLNIFLTDEA